jgi:DNA-binding CsgD family transcriptional regulator
MSDPQSTARCRSIAPTNDSPSGLTAIPRARTPALSQPSTGLPLTDREREIAMFIGLGLSKRELAARLTISVRTVEGHIHIAMAKFTVCGYAGAQGLSCSVVAVGSLGGDRGALECVEHMRAAEPAGRPTTVTVIAIRGLSCRCGVTRQEFPTQSAPTDLPRTTLAGRKKPRCAHYPSTEGLSVIDNPTYD